MVSEISDIEVHQDYDRRLFTNIKFLFIWYLHLVNVLSSPDSISVLTFLNESMCYRLFYHFVNLVFKIFGESL